MISYSIHSRKHNSTCIKTYTHITHHLPPLPLLPFLPFLSQASIPPLDTVQPTVHDSSVRKTRNQPHRGGLGTTFSSSTFLFLLFSSLLFSFLFFYPSCFSPLPSCPSFTPRFSPILPTFFNFSIFPHNLHILFPIPCSLVSRKGNRERTRGRN